MITSAAGHSVNSASRHRIDLSRLSSGSASVKSSSSSAASFLAIIMVTLATSIANALLSRPMKWSGVTYEIVAWLCLARRRARIRFLTSTSSRLISLYAT